MAATKKPPEPLQFSGGPLGLSAVLRQPVGGPMPVDLELPRLAGAAVQAHAEPAGKASVVRINLPLDTPPGRYEGTVRVGGRQGEEQPIVVSVAPKVHLQVVPELLSFVAAPGQRVSAGLTLMNLGNAAAMVGRAYAFPILDAGGDDCGVLGSLIAGLGPDERRIDRIADSLAESHGGTVRLRIRKGWGELQPGEVRDLQLTLTMPAGLRTGHSYWGTWRLHDLRYYVRITADGERSPGPKRARSKASSPRSRGEG